LIYLFLETEDPSADCLDPFLENAIEKNVLPKASFKRCPKNS